MPRKRNISTEISTDKRINRLSDFAALLYTWIIPHADDDGGFTADSEEIHLKVIPGRQKDLPKIQGAVDEMANLELIQLATDGRLYFPLDAFYKHQNYIPLIKRTAASEKRKSLIFKAAAISPQIPASPSPSPTLSPTPIRNQPQPQPPPFQPSAGPPQIKKPEPERKKRELDPEVKLATAQVYDVDRQKFSRLVVWVTAALNNYHPKVVAAALNRFLPFAPDVDNWWPYLDKLLDKEQEKARVRRAEFEHERRKAQDREFLTDVSKRTEGQKGDFVASLVRGIGRKF